MKSINLLITVTAISLASSSFAGSDKIQKLRDEFHAKAKKTMRPVNEEYEAKLQYGLKNALKFNKDDDCIAIQAELKALKEDPSYLLNVVDSSEGVAQFAGKWRIDIDAGLYTIANISEDGHFKGIESGWRNGNDWSGGARIDSDIVYDAEADCFKVLLCKTDGFTLKMVGRNRMKVGFFDSMTKYPETAPGKAKRIKE